MQLAHAALSAMARFATTSVGVPEPRITWTDNAVDEHPSHWLQAAATLSDCTLALVRKTTTCPVAAVAVQPAHVADACAIASPSHDLPDARSS